MQLLSQSQLLFSCGESEICFSANSASDRDDDPKLIIGKYIVRDHIKCVTSYGHLYEHAVVIGSHRSNWSESTGDPCP
jgi:hypothetical protein